MTKRLAGTVKPFGVPVPYIEASSKNHSSPAHTGVILGKRVAWPSHKNPPDRAERPSVGNDRALSQARRSDDATYSPPLMPPVLITPDQRARLRWM